MSTVSYKSIYLPNGVDLFYLETCDSHKPTLLLLHGFPTSSNQFQKLIPLLSPHFHILAPDLPGFGQTRVRFKYDYTFENLGKTVGLFLKEKKVQKFSMYLFDYGAAAGFRVALGQPENITAIISQNGSANGDGVSSKFWEPIRYLWNLEDSRVRNRENFNHRNFKFNLDLVSSDMLGLMSFQRLYTYGENDHSKVNPEFALVDYLTAAQLKDNESTQLSYLLDYRKNLYVYTDFRSDFNQTNVPILAVWGKNSEVYPGRDADAFKNASKDVKVVLIDGGHFISLTHANEVAAEIIDFFRERKIIN